MKKKLWEKKWERKQIRGEKNEKIEKTKSGKKVLKYKFWRKKNRITSLSWLCITLYTFKQITLTTDILLLKLS